MQYYSPLHPHLLTHIQKSLFLKVTPSNPPSSSTSLPKGGSTVSSVRFPRQATALDIWSSGVIKAVCGCHSVGEGDIWGSVIIWYDQVRCLVKVSHVSEWVLLWVSAVGLCVVQHRREVCSYHFGVFWKCGHVRVWVEDSWWGIPSWCLTNRQVVVYLLQIEVIHGLAMYV